MGTTSYRLCVNVPTIDVHSNVGEMPITKKKRIVFAANSFLGEIYCNFVELYAECVCSGHLRSNGNQLAIQRFDDNDLLYPFRIKLAKWSFCFCHDASQEQLLSFIDKLQPLISLISDRCCRKCLVIGSKM